MKTLHKTFLSFPPVNINQLAGGIIPNLHILIIIGLVRLPEFTLELRLNEARAIVSVCVSCGYWSLIGSKVCQIRRRIIVLTRYNLESISIMMRRNLI